MKINYLEYLQQTVADNQVIISDLSRSYSVFQIKVACDLLTKDLKKLKINIIAIYADNSVDWIISDLSCQQAELILLPLPTFFSDEQIQHAIKSCNVEVVITDRPKSLTKIYKESKEVRVKGIKLSLVQIKGNQESCCFPNGTGKITFTSGSTGKPKGVCVSNKQLHDKAKMIAECVAIKKPRHLCMLPLSTLLENVAGIYAPLIAEGEVIIPSLEEIGFEGSSAINHSKLLDIISRIRPQSIILTPELLLILVTASSLHGWKIPSSLKFVAVGGSKVSDDLMLMAKKHKIPVYEGYGLSECTSVVSLNTQKDYKSGSCGKALSQVEINIVDNEIIVFGNIMLGYINNKESWHRESYPTGDMGYIDSEGYMFISGRKKNLIISSYGRNISPEWLEAGISANPLFSEVIVFGDAKPFCIALLTLAQNDITNKQIQEAVNQFNKVMPDYAQILRWILLITPLREEKGLVTENGKLKRHEIYKKYESEIKTLYQDK